MKWTQVYGNGHRGMGNLRQQRIELTDEQRNLVADRPALERARRREEAGGAGEPGEHPPGNRRRIRRDDV